MTTLAARITALAIQGFMIDQRDSVLYESAIRSYSRMVSAADRATAQSRDAGHCRGQGAPAPPAHFAKTASTRHPQPGGAPRQCRDGDRHADAQELAEPDLHTVGRGALDDDDVGD